MRKTLKIAFLIVFFTALALPSLHFFGADETSWHKIYGWERIPKNPDFTFKGFVDRSYQNTLTEHFAKSFFLRHVFYPTSRQINEIANFGKFHPVGYAGKTIDGKPFDERGVGVIFEDAYNVFHLNCRRDLRPEDFTKSIALLKDFDEFCRTNGMDFVIQCVPDKPQAYEDYLPDWMKWVWNYENFPVQSYVAKLFNENGIKTLDGLQLFSDWRKQTKTWLYPPGGTHMTCLASAWLEEEIVRRVNAAGRIHLNVNPLVRVEERTNEIWSVDNDISMQLNCWRNRHIDTNCHLFPVFEKTNQVMNAGSVFIIGDCYRDQMAQIFGDSGLFAKEKILKSTRVGQKPEHLKKIVGDLKLVVITFQSFNTALFNEREMFRRTDTYDIYRELQTIFSALRTAIAQPRTANVDRASSPCI